MPHASGGRHHESKTANFLSGFVKGALGGLLMAGLVVGVSLLFSHLTVATLVAQLPWYALGMPLITGTFSGVMEVMRNTPGNIFSNHGQHHRDHDHRAPDMVPAPVMTPMVTADRSDAPDLAHAAADRTNWADRVGSQRRDAVSQILARGDMSDRDRASAILAEQQAAASAQQQR